MRVLLDACVLYPTIMREILLEVAQDGYFEPLWSAGILAEWQYAAGRGGEAVGAQAGVELALINSVWKNASVDITEHDPEEYLLPDPDDRHVLAAAVAGKSDFILTMNLKDFPTRVLGRYDIHVQHPDAFLLEAAKSFGIEGAVYAVWEKAEAISGESLELRKLLKRTGLPRLGRYFADLPRRNSDASRPSARQRS